MVFRMTIDIGEFGVWRRHGEMEPGQVAEAERLGYGAFWIGGSPPADLAVIETALEGSERIVVVTGIVNMWRADPAELANSYLRISKRHPDRFLLGVGVGHPEATREYTAPLDKIRSYLDELVERGVPGEAMILAALGPKVLAIAAERTAGAHPYLTTPRHTRMARAVMGDGCLLAPEQKVVLDTDVGRARALGRQQVSRYLRLTNYRASLLREGWTRSDLDDGGSDALIDELVIHGTVPEVAEGVMAHFTAGAGHVSIQTLGDDPMGQHAALAAELFR